ncbi:MAG: exodeoxyribonuclease VII large subunit [Deferribacteres bacterium]|nr:exodeoxyribonuclease VII large subunit [Deferribacteres bacterium]
MLEEKVYTVFEITQEIKELIEQSFPAIWVEGEVSNLSKSPAGHYYFTLKDEKAQLEAVLFKGRARSFLKFLRNGAKVMCFGSLNVYAPRGRYQLEVVVMKEVGLGALYAALEELKKKLEGEGLFDDKFKKPLPELPRKIGVVTSPRGAAIKDILNTIRRRFSKVHILLYPAKVQGEGAAEEIAEGIRFFNRHKLVDVIIVGRGGGSIEDLWAFNEEIVARAIFESEIPVISAVGHQRDYTLADLVADKRAATPTAAAEIVVKQEEEIREKLKSLKKRMANVITGRLGQHKSIFSSLKRRLELKDPRKRVSDGRLRLDELEIRLIGAAKRGLNAKKERLLSFKKMLEVHSPDKKIKLLKDRIKEIESRLISDIQNLLNGKRHRLNLLKAKIEASSPRNPLLKGYAICYDEKGKVIKNAFKVARGSLIKVELAEGALICQVKEKQIL